MISCGSNDKDPPSEQDGTGGGGQGGMGGDSAGGQGGMGGDSDLDCVEREHTLSEVCPSWTSGFDPRSQSTLSCFPEPPREWEGEELELLEKGALVFEYREGCGKGRWSLLNDPLPGYSILWHLDGFAVIGCQAFSDSPSLGDCGSFSISAGERYECASEQVSYCVETSMGGLGGMGN